MATAKKPAKKAATKKTIKPAKVPAKKGAKTNPPKPADTKKASTESTTTRKRGPSPTSTKTFEALRRLGTASPISKVAAELGVTNATARKALKALGEAVKIDGKTKTRVYSLA